MYFHKAQEKPQRYGNFQDIQYSIKRNMESIYKCNPDDEVLVMPLFWGLPCLDFSGNNNYGTNHGATYKDGSLDFDGDTDYVNVADSASLDINSVFTITSWIYPHSVGAAGGAVIIFKWADSTGTDNSYFFRLTNYRYLRTGLKDETGTNRVYSDTVSQVPLNQWSQVIGQYDGTYLNFFLNGNFLSQLSIGSHTIKQTADDVWIGRQVDLPTSDADFDGSIDEVRIAKAARTAETIGIFYERPWDLYRRVARPIWSLPAAPSIYIPQIIIF